MCDKARRIRNEIDKKRKELADFAEGLGQARRAMLDDMDFKNADKVAKSLEFIQKASHELWMAQLCLME